MQLFAFIFLMASAMASALASSITASSPMASRTTFLTKVTEAPAVTRVAADDIHWHTANGGALDPHPRVDPDSPVTGLTAPPEWKIRMTNNAGVALTTLHVKNAPKSSSMAELPDPLGGIPAPGTMAPDRTHELVVPTGWSGRVAFAEAGKIILKPDGTPLVDYALGDIDVSYIDGYTFPIMCPCDANGMHLSGCDDPKLWEQSIPCPDLNVHGPCRNPHRDINGGHIDHPHEWFKACQGRAYTFPDDNQANSNGQCQSGIVNCQILAKKK